MARVCVCVYYYYLYILCFSATLLSVSHYHLRLQSTRTGLSPTFYSHPKSQTTYLHMSVDISTFTDAETFETYGNLSFIIGKDFLKLILFASDYQNSCIPRKFNMTRTINQNRNPIRRLNGLQKNLCPPLLQIRSRSQKFLDLWRRLNLKFGSYSFVQNYWLHKEHPKSI